MMLGKRLGGMITSNAPKTGPSPWHIPGTFLSRDFGLRCGLRLQKWIPQQSDAPNDALHRGWLEMTSFHPVFHPADGHAARMFNDRCKTWNWYELILILSDFLFGTRRFALAEWGSNWIFNAFVSNPFYSSFSLIRKELWIPLAGPMLVASFSRVAKLG